MRLLLTADLHRDGRKLLWLLDNAPKHDALLIAGDHLDIFASATLSDQKAGALRWKDAYLNTGKSLAWCSGNHDFFYGEDSPMAQASPFWMREDASHSQYITDGESKILESKAGGLAVTTVPWPVTGQELVVDGYRTNYLTHVKSLLQKGKKLQTEEGTPWIVLCHEPPALSPLCREYDKPEGHFAKELILEAQPDFSLHGHIHLGPTFPEGSWHCKLGQTTCFNPGQSLPGESPHHILLQIKGPNHWKASWESPEKTEEISA